jgi:beta-glucanase (GH16 family)
MLGSQPGVSWPTVGESDIMENWPTTSNIPGPGATGNCSTIHTKVTGGSGKGRCFTLPNGGQVNTAFHGYGEIWSANMIQFYVDDPTQPFFVVTASDLPAGDVWPFSSSADSFFVIMNMAVGGTLGAPTDSATGSQAPMLVDWVRQYLPSTIPAPQMTPSDTVNKYTVDFTNSSSASPTVTVTTTANTRHGGHSNGTPPGNYTVTVNAFTISSSDATIPSASTAFNLTVN